MQAKDGGTVEDAIRELDNDLGVLRWRLSREQDEPGADDREPGAPAWWVDEEQASASFLLAMGIGPDALAKGP